jgi:UPF0176 protein
MPDTYTITAFYKFVAIEEADLAARRSELQRAGFKFRLFGLTLLSTEGVNGTIAGSAQGIREFKEYLQQEYGDILFKDSYAQDRPFKRWLVQIRDEIVAIKDKSILPDGDRNHISPQQWHDTLSTEENVVVIDTRNICETEIGMFKDAIDPRLNSFGEFPEWIENSGIDKDQKVLMYCTGGIRCEKALIAMQREGYKEVYQLKGGILDYLKAYPDGHWNGECFVFDNRVSVDTNLNPSKRYSFCPHCGDPGDLIIHCSSCEKKSVICKDCSQENDRNTCSKHCAEVYRRKQSPTT